MNCYYHPDQPAVAQCAKCHRGLCKDCFDQSQFQIVGDLRCCPDCYNEAAIRVTEVVEEAKQSEYDKYKSRFIKYIIALLICAYLMKDLNMEFWVMLVVSLIFTGWLAGFDMERDFGPIGSTASVVDRQTGRQQTVYENRGCLGVVLLALLLGGFVGYVYVLYVLLYKFPSIQIKKWRSRN